MPITDPGQTVRISALPELTTANQDVQFPINDAGVTKRVKLSTVIDMLRGFAVSAHGNVTAGTLAVDTNAARVHTAILAASVDSPLDYSGQPAEHAAIGAAGADPGRHRRPFMTFPNSFRWQGGFSPSLSTAPGATDGIQLMTFDSGVTWIASIAFQVAAAA